MTGKRSLYPLRRERLLEAVRDFETKHGQMPTPRHLHQRTGWGVHAIRSYLRQLQIEGIHFPEPAAQANASRYHQRRELLLNFLHSYQQAMGYPPTIREIASEFGWDRRTIRHYLLRLAEEGSVRFNCGSRRAIVLITSKIDQDDHR